MNQHTHSSVTSSSASRVFQGALRWINSALYSPFSLETMLSEWEPTRSHLYLIGQAIVTNAPDYAGFALPHFFAKQNDEVSISGGAQRRPLYAVVRPCSR